MGACVSGKAGGSCLGQNDDFSIAARQGDLIWMRVLGLKDECPYSSIVVCLNRPLDERDEFMDKCVSSCCQS